MNGTPHNQLLDQAAVSANAFSIHLTRAILVDMKIAHAFSPSPMCELERVAFRGQVPLPGFRSAYAAYSVSIESCSFWDNGEAA
jgi:hypothetical protein